MKRVAITGASGFVGSSLSQMLKDMGYEILPISISTLHSQTKLGEIISKSEIIINLAGANILSRWSDSYKKVLYSSRIDTTKKLIKAIENSPVKPKLLISTSAVGIYDDTHTHTESSSDYAKDFLAKICTDWETEALRAKEFGTRVALFRFGIVMGDGGALSKMLFPFSLGLGGEIGSGKQPFPFIHIEDLKRAYVHIIQNENLEGIFNLVAPELINNSVFTKTLASTLHRPAFFDVPKFVIELLFGDGATVLTKGQKVIPQRLLDSGFEFQFKTAKDTLNDLVRR